MAKLCLGTVQFGMKYGVNNTVGQPAVKDSFNMLDTALESGQISTIDTASAYGQAEEILGRFFAERRGLYDVKIISKLRPNIIVGKSAKTEQIVEKELLNSLRTLGVEQLDGYLLHTPGYIYRKDILEALLKMKEKGYVQNIGVSIYNIKEGFAAIRSGVVDYIQIPYSVLDQRAVKTGFVRDARERGIKIFARSAFLQGLFMMDTVYLPQYLKKAGPYLELFNELLNQYQVNMIDALIHFVTDEKDIDYMVFGVDTRQQLVEDIEAYKNHTITRELIEDLKEQITNVEDSIIIPSLWSNGKKTE